MVSFKKNLFVSAVAVALATIAVHGESYEAKRLLRHEAMEVAEAEEADDSECGSLEMAEEENTGSSKNNNNNWGDSTQTTQPPSNTWSTGGSPTTQGSGANTWTDGGTWTSGGSTNTWGTGGTTTNTGTTDQTQFTQGEFGGEAETSNINFNSFQNPNNVGTVSPQ